MPYTGGPYVAIGTIMSANALAPINIPYERVTDGMTDVMDRLYTDFVPWEWWIDYTGTVNAGFEKGTDKSLTIAFEAGARLNKVTAERTTKQSVQRARITGQGESEKQDQTTSDWHVDTAAMDVINSFYEKVDSRRDIANKNVADIVAQVVLAMLANIREQITLEDVDFLPYTANDVDIGDYVTATDPDTGLTGAYRIYTIEKTITPRGGEDVDLTLTKRKVDVSDRLARLQKRLDILQSSNTVLDKLLNTGGKQGGINPDLLEDVWGITASNKYFFEAPEESSEGADDPNMTFTEAVGGGTYSCDKDEFYVKTDGSGSQDTICLSAGAIVREVHWEDNPRFACEFEMDTEQGTDWEDNDDLYIGIGCCGNTCTISSAFFGFKIEYDASYGGGQFRIHIVLNTDVPPDEDIDVTIDAGDIIHDTKYRIEARVDWDEKIIRYYFGSDSYDFDIIGILPIPTAVSQIDMSVLMVKIIESAARDPRCVVIYNWNSQAKCLHAG